MTQQYKINSLLSYSYPTNQKKKGTTYISAYMIWKTFTVNNLWILDHFRSDLHRSRSMKQPFLESPVHLNMKWCRKIFCSADVGLNICLWRCWPITGCDWSETGCLKCFLSYLSKQFFSLAGFYKVSDWVFIFHTKSLKPKGESTLANSGPKSLEASAWAWDP